VRSLTRGWVASESVKSKCEFGVMSPDMVEWFSKNWAVLVSAPAVFASLTIIGLVFGYAVGTYFKNGEIAILEGLLSMKANLKSHPLTRRKPRSIACRANSQR
jgi:hypothetical protein